MKTKILAISLLATLGWTEVPAVLAQQSMEKFYVPVEPDDCINTLILRMVVAATHNGKAYSEFGGSRIVMQRKTPRANCRVEMHQYNDIGQLEDHKIVQCLDANPLDQRKQDPEYFMY